MISRFKNSQPVERPERGAISIMAGIVLLLFIVTLGLVVDSGRLYFEKRRLQKIADFAALESVSLLPNGSCESDPDAAFTFALASAAQNGFTPSSSQELQLSCVTPTVAAGIHQRPTSADIGGPAVWVTVEKTVPASLVQRFMVIFGSTLADNITLSAEALAQREGPTASFSIGSELLHLDNGLLRGLLKAVGLDLDLSALNGEGLASITTTPAGLLNALGIDLDIQELRALSPQGLLDVIDDEVNVMFLPDVVDLLLGGNDFGLRGLVTNVSGLANTTIKLFGLEGDDALIRLDGSVEQLGSSLDAAISLEQLLTTALWIGVHEQNRGLKIPGLNVLGLVDVQAGIVEPPSIGIGPVGTTAYNAQIRLYVDVDTSSLLSGGLKWLTEDILGTRVHLPIWVDVATAYGTLQEVDCSTPKPTVDIAVNSGILTACVGEVKENRRWSTALACEAGSLEETQLIELLHLPVLSGKTKLGVLNDTSPLVLTNLEAGVQTSISEHYPQHTAQRLGELGDTVEDVVTGLLDLLSGLFRRPYADGLDYSSAAQAQLISQLATQYLEESAKDNAGFYNVQKVLDLVLNGGTELDANGNKVLPPLVAEDWIIRNIIPTSCLLSVCPVSTWKDGRFSDAFKFYTSTPGSLLDVLGVSTLPNGYLSCAGLLSSLLNWNGCVKHNLNKFLQEKPGGLDLSQNNDGNNIANPKVTDVNCSGALCKLLKPVLTTVLKPALNGVGDLLGALLGSGGLGVDIADSKLEVQAISCGIPSLLR